MTKTLLDEIKKMRSEEIDLNDKITKLMRKNEKLSLTLKNYEEEKDQYEEQLSDLKEEVSRFKKLFFIFYYKINK